MKQLVTVALATCALASYSCKGIQEIDSNTKIVTGEEKEAYSQNLKLMEEAKQDLAKLIESDEEYGEQIAALKKQGYVVNYLNKVDWRKSSDANYELAYSQTGGALQPEQRDHTASAGYYLQGPALETSDQAFFGEYVQTDDSSSTPQDEMKDQPQVAPPIAGTKTIRVKIQLDKPFKSQSEIAQRRIVSAKILEPIDIFAALR